MHKSIIKRFLLLTISSGSGFLVGGIVVTPAIALMNHLANDGTIFPPSMIAFFVVAPISFILLIAQLSVLVYEGSIQRRLESELLWIGLTTGIIAGLIPYIVAIAPNQSRANYGDFIAYCSLGIFMGSTVFGCHWIVNKLTI